MSRCKNKPGIGSPVLLLAATVVYAGAGVGTETCGRRGAGHRSGSGGAGSSLGVDAARAGVPHCATSASAAAAAATGARVLCGREARPFFLPLEATNGSSQFSPPPRLDQQPRRKTVTVRRGLLRARRAWAPPCPWPLGPLCCVGIRSLFPSFVAGRPVFGKKLRLSLRVPFCFLKTSAPVPPF